ncbi:MAG TPA: hypothetical protein VGR20_17815 [Acidimicrobiia bacterium]|jgi:hypothetical protein|nr:hypothetical protein [Acidimicrobiia bacterium]
MDDRFSDADLEITELPEREEMILGILNITGLSGVGAALGGLVDSLLPITVGVGS